jgi:hypothetical protein
MDMNADRVEWKSWSRPCSYENDYIKEEKEYSTIIARYKLLSVFIVSFYKKSEAVLLAGTASLLQDYSSGSG